MLAPTATRKDIETLCDEAARYGFATVCVNPTWVSLCAQRLRGTSVGVCAVVGFPLGATTSDVKGYETQRVIFDGAREVDMVINVGALKSGRDELVYKDIRAVVEAAMDGGAGAQLVTRGGERSGVAQGRDGIVRPARRIGLPPRIEERFER